MIPGVHGNAVRYANPELRGLVSLVCGPAIAEVLGNIPEPPCPLLLDLAAQVNVRNMAGLEAISFSRTPQMQSIIMKHDVNF